MPYQVTQLISRAYNIAGIIGKEYETISGNQLNEGLELLNEVLSSKTANQRLIPYYSAYTFTGVIGHEEYFIPDLVLAETLTFSIATVRYSMRSVTRREYFGTSRANDVDSLPFIYHCERTLNGTNLFMYYTPNEAYVFILEGKFSLSEVVLGQDLLVTLDQYYIDYLKYALAEYVCQEYNITLQPQAVKRLDQLEAAIFDISPIDFTTSKISMLQKGGAISYAQVNIGGAWIGTSGG